MNKVLGVLGYILSGSGAFIDLLREYDETSVLDGTFEFRIARSPDGLGDLDYHLNKSLLGNNIAIKRFKSYIKDGVKWGKVNKKEINKAVNDFISRIVQLSWMGRRLIADHYFNYRVKSFILMMNDRLYLSKIFKDINKPLLDKIEYSIRPELFDEASRIFIIDIMNALGFNMEKEVIVLKHSFMPHDPEMSFKYFENPVAIVVDRDPRDCYLLGKLFSRLDFMPRDNVDNFIKYYRLSRYGKSSIRSQKRPNIIYFDFEELVYNYDNTVNKVADYVGIKRHIRKGMFFNPNRARCNTQLFKAYTEYRRDIEKIEKELTEHLFPFDNYSDIEREGEMYLLAQGGKGLYTNTILKT